MGVLLVRWMNWPFIRLNGRSFESDLALSADRHVWIAINCSVFTVVCICCTKKIGAVGLPFFLAAGAGYSQEKSVVTGATILGHPREYPAPIQQQADTPYQFGPTIERHAPPPPPADRSYFDSSTSVRAESARPRRAEKRAKAAKTKKKTGRQAQSH